MKLLSGLRWLLLIMLFQGSFLWAMGNDAPLLTTVHLDRLEWLNGRDENMLQWQLSLVSGHDLQKLVLETEGERSGGGLEESTLALFYQQALDANWDLLAGFTTDIKPAPGRHWLSVGLKGLAPWFLETRSVLHFGEAGRVALNVEIEKEILLTQDWMLLPGLELNVYAQNDFATGHGSGISDAVLGLYMVRRANRKLMPYIGIQESRKFGKTAEYALKNGDIVSDTQWLIGVKAWY